MVLHVLRATARAFGHRVSQGILESLEGRRLMSVAAPADAPVDNNPPQVEAVFVNSTTWAPAFRSFLEAEHQGSAAYGFEADKLEFNANENLNSHILPWNNLNQVSFQFDENVNVQQDDLVIESASQTAYAVTAFTYDPATFVATWTLDRAIGADVLDLRLDGTSETGVTDLAGNLLQGNCRDQDNSGGDGSAEGARPGRDFCQGLAVLPGDVNSDGRVNALDVAAVKSRLITSTTNQGSGNGKYGAFFDVNGDGRINALDIAAVKGHLNQRLPDRGAGA
jgi:hypothetical protein